MCLCRKRIAGLVVASALGPASGSALAQSGPVPVSVAEVVRREVAAGQDFVGTVVPLRTSVVGSAVDERVVDFAVNEGDRVESGQMLARLRTDTLEIELDAARADLEVRKQELAEQENGSRPDEVEQGRARLGQAQALQDYNRARLRRAQSLTQRSSVSPEELDEALSASAQAEQALREAEASLRLLEQGPRRERIEQARARVGVQNAVVRRLEDRLAEHTIVAPFDGYVVAEHTEAGQWVARGDPIAEVVELDRVDVAVNVLEDYVRYLHVGTPARAEVGALPDETFTGEVALIVPRAETRSRTFPVKVRLANHERNGVVALKSGMFARVTLPVGERQQAILVPKDALVLGGPSPLVFVVDPDPKDPRRGTVRPISVVLGVAQDALIQVKGDLLPGRTVVVEGNERLRPGQEVEVVGEASTPGPEAAGGR